MTSSTFPEGTSLFEGTSFFQVLSQKYEQLLLVLVHIFLMNRRHVLSLTLFDEHVCGTSHTKWKVPTQKSELTFYCLQYETQIQLGL